MIHGRIYSSAVVQTAKEKTFLKFTYETIISENNK